MASALSGKLNLPKFLNIQGVQNKLQRAGLSTNPCLSKVALLVKVACSMRAHTHTHTETSEASVLPKKQLHCLPSFCKSWENFYECLYCIKRTVGFCSLICSWHKALYTYCLLWRQAKLSSLNSVLICTILLGLWTAFDNRRIHS